MTVSSASCFSEHGLPGAGRWQQKHAGADPGDPEILQSNVTRQISGLEQLSCEEGQK